MKGGAMAREPVQRKSPDLTAEQVERLRALFPEAFSEGRVDWDALRATLGDAVDDRPERYSFSWAGKRDAIRLLQTPSAATLAPCPEESLDFDSTQNVFIEGDNLEVLKLLYKAYFGRVKMIYIDPPYNTGNDFVYPDNYADPLDTYLRLTGQADAAGNLLTSNPETSGRYHSAWLSMMYPRLFLARQLLREDGVIFVSIDDSEVHNLRMLMNEIFGEENFVAAIVWQAKDTPGNASSEVALTHNYVVCYKRSDAFKVRLLARTESQLANYKNPDNDPRGPWLGTPLTRGEYRPRDYYALLNPAGEEVLPPPGNSWRRPKATIERYQREGRLWWGRDGTSRFPFVKTFLSEMKEGVVPITWWDYRFAGSTRRARAEMKALFEGGRGFDTPKPTLLIRRMLELASTPDEGDLIIDFFAGSSTTAHAVLAQNREDGGNRRFIMVQLPEPTGRTDYPTIADIGKERIRRVVARMKAEDEGKLPLSTRDTPEDLGCRVFKLAPSNYRPWPGVAGAAPDAYAEQMALFTDPLVDGWQPEGVIWEVALKEGYGLDSRVERLPGLAANTVYRVSDPARGQSFTICLDARLDVAALRALHLGKDDLFVCRDAALDDAQAANLALQCRLKVI